MSASMKVDYMSDIGIDDICEKYKINVKSMPILINDVAIENNDEFYKACNDFMRGI
jgi:hypothetical protein